MADFGSRVDDLQADFERIADRADWVSACLAIRPRHFWALGFGRAKAGRYLIHKVWSYGGQPATLPPHPEMAGDEERIVDHANPVYSELLAHTQRAGILLNEMCAAGRYRMSLIPPNIVLDSPLDPVQLWFAFLIHSPGTLGNCLAKAQDGMCAACGQIREGETTYVWIDHYAGVCLVGLALLKATLEVSTPASADLRPADVPKASAAASPLRQGDAAPTDATLKTSGTPPAASSLTFLHGAFVYRGREEPLKGKPLAVLQALDEAHGKTLTLKALQDKVWPDCQTGQETIRSAIATARKALRRAIKATEGDDSADPIPVVDRGSAERTAWRLKLP